MKFKFATDYSFDEMVFIKKYNCEILSEIKLSKTAFTEKLLRMIKYMHIRKKKWIKEPVKSTSLNFMS